MLKSSVHHVRGLRWRGTGSHPLRWFYILLCLFVPATPVAAGESVLAEDQTWSGEVRVEEDLLVPPGRTLTILPGTRVVFAVAPSTKTEPVFWNPGTELAVAGRLVAGAPGAAPVVFGGDGVWGGLVGAPGSEVFLTSVRIVGADEALLCVGAGCTLRDSEVEGGEYGLVLGPGATLDARGVTVRGARVGVLDARVSAGGDSAPWDKGDVVIVDPVDAARLQVPSPVRRVSLPVRTAEGDQRRVEYLGEYTVSRDETWHGEVVLTGRVSVTPEAVLTLEPGTRVRFRRRDSNGDGLGEGELLVLGGIRSRGLPAAPVVFESAEDGPTPGDWDKVSLIASEDRDNRFQYTVFRHGVQALHAHFSQFVAEDCLFTDNLRAVQFQESEGSTLMRSVFVGNKQALRFRDSRVTARGNVLFGNLFAVHAFRSHLEFADNVLEATFLGGFLAKESQVRFVANRVLLGRDGVRMRQAGSVAEIAANLLEGFAEDALSLSSVVGTVRDNRLARAGLDLIGMEDSPVRVDGNYFSGAGRHAVHLKGSQDVDARGNFWAGMDPADAVYDRADDPELGRVKWKPVLSAAPLLSVPGGDW